jgi:DNA polymerase I
LNIYNSIVIVCYNEGDSSAFSLRMTIIPMKKLLLIDGNALMHRAYHALPPLTAPDGTVINAVYGFFSMVFTVVSEMKPDYLIVSFDISKPTYRQSLYAGYHEHRPQMADDLGAQFAIVHNALEKMQIKIFEVEGFEADDVIGTISHQVVTGTDDVEVVILTGDRDLLQLINSRVNVLMPVVGVKTTIVHDEKSVEEKYGVKPSQFVDYKALIGDASDGYPGVTGIGPKTAAKLIQEYGTFEALYEKIGELPEKYATKLATDAEQAALAKKLATIMRDVPITCDVRQAGWLDVNTSGVWEVFDWLGFDSLRKRFSPLFKTLEESKKGEQMGLEL